MTSKVVCNVKWRRSAEQRIAFVPGKEIGLHLAEAGRIGGPLSPIGADLIDFATAVFWIERRILRRRESPIELDLRMPVRAPGAWSGEVVGSFERLLGFMGNARWRIDVTARRGNKQVPEHDATPSPAETVALFSGGLDSLCGAASNTGKAPRLVSYYSRQRRLQSELADELGYAHPVQWRMRRVKVREPGRSFHYRSLLFLCLGAATASACGARSILQYENGILASAIPPAPAWRMTKHAHPLVQQLASEAFSGLFGEEVVVENPFLLLTKRQCCASARASVGERRFGAMARRSESCWHYWSNRLPGSSPKYLETRRLEKRPGEHCGICIPCIVRRTALDDLARTVSTRARPYACDMTRPKWQSDERFGRDFRAYYGFLDLVRSTRSLSQFYRVLPAPGRHLFADDAVDRKGLYALFRTFSDEFMETFLP